MCEWDNYREILTDTLKVPLVYLLINSSAFIGMHGLRIRQKTSRRAWAVTVGEQPLI